MDRPTTRGDADARLPELGSREELVLPSRRASLQICRSALGAGRARASDAGPILLTGDAGSGKTWLWRTLESESGPSDRWIGVDLTPANDPVDFYRLIAHEAGLLDPGRRTCSRPELVDHLAERRADGERLTLVIEEAHNLSLGVWEEVRVLANRLDQPGGFSGMILVGQTPLARRFSTQAFSSIETRLAARVHLGPIDADEARELLGHLRPGREWSRAEVDLLHRDGSGNPRRILRRVEPIPLPIAIESRPVATAPSPEPPQPAPIPAPIHVPAPLIGPAKPPIRVEENMIEVGWSPEDSSTTEAEGLSPRAAVGTGSSPAGEEAVHDHYAALQAWREWSENQTRRSLQGVRQAESSIVDDSVDEMDEEPEEEDIDDEPIALPPATRPNFRTEGGETFAPFGQLFSRMAQAREPE